MSGISSAQRGRHRKPSTTGRTLAKTALASAVVGAPLITAGQAQAAPDNVWDKVAQCESGGNWGTSTGNGFQGGLQFTQSTWRSFGGTQYASSANKASREEQIAVGEKVLAGQGWNAWPVCSRKAGARGSSPSQRVITAKGPSKSTSAGKSTGKSYGRSIGKKTDKRVTSAPPSTGRHALKAAAPTTKPLTNTPAVPVAAPPVTQLAARLSPLVSPAQPAATAPLTALPSAPSAPAPVLAAAAPAPAPAVAAPAPAPAAVAPAPAAPAPAQKADPHPTQLAADAAPIPGGANPSAAVPGPRTYLVRPGDTLSSIAGSQAVAGGWQAIYDANRGALSNANMIRPGQQLAL